MLLLCFMFPSLTYANTERQGLIVQTERFSFPIILISLLIEYFFYQWVFKSSIKSTVLYTMLANLISGVLGIWVVGMILSGFPLYRFNFFLDQLLDQILGSGNWHWAMLINILVLSLVGGAINALLELLAIRVIWKQPFSKRTYLILWIANIITVAIAMISVAVIYSWIWPVDLFMLRV